MSKASRKVPRIQDVQNTVTKWLQQAEYQIVEKASDPRTLWVFEAQKGRLNFAILRPRNNDCIYILASVKIGDKDAAKLAETGEDERKNLLWNLRFGMLRLELEFTGIVDPLRIIEMRSVIYDDGLTEDNFFTRFRRVNNSVYFVQWCLSRLLDDRTTIDDAFKSNDYLM